MRPRSERDFFAGLLFVAVGLGFAWAATGYEFGQASAPGPGYFPFGLGVLLALLGAMVLFKSLSVEAEQGERIGGLAWRPLIFIVVAIVLFGLGLPRLGLPLTVAGVAFLVSFASPEAKVWEAALLGLGLALFCCLVFITGLHLNLPLWPTPPAGWLG